VTTGRVGSVPTRVRAVAGSGLRRPNSSVSTRTLEEALRGLQIIDVDPDSGAIIATTETPASKQFAKDPAPSLAELGSVSPSPFTAWLRREYNPELRDRQGLRKFDEMRKSDSTVRSTLRAMKTPILNARWFIQPASQSAQDKKIADFVLWNLTEGMSISWGQIVWEALLMLDFGYYMFEKVFTNQHPDMPGKICWQKFAPRHPLDVEEWNWDANGGPLSVDVLNPVPAGTGAVNTFTTSIPISKLAVFTFDKEAGDMTGTSLLRSAYKPWYYKQQLEKIDAIQKERHGIGVPIITLPLGFNDNDKLLAEAIGRNLRTNERAHVVMPPGWTIEFAKLQGQLTDALKSIEYHSTEIAKNILATFIENRAGAADASQDLFLKSCRYVAAVVEEVFNIYCIPQLIRYNYANVHKFPKLKARRIGEVIDQRTFSFAIRNMVGAGVIRPDDPLEDLVRDEMDLPPIDPTTIRVVTTPQNTNMVPPQPGEDNSKGVPPSGVPPKVNPPGTPVAGPPRQAAPSASPPAKNSGIDRSGG
jgi:hypothetical protein